MTASFSVVPGSGPHGIHPQDGRLTVTMFNISPEGQEVLAVEAAYRKG